ncbi:hypothetical protein FSP39_019403 [Pinctada imbricata]|uniref:Matrin-type domain-containing protein n=1 Tax=Pinctada imbricata TaxID=66713 RepID=A0AA88XN94_PINIB|nr:hypothetical protein FSP39_019403 [Pinctada imbricata]
MNRGRSRGTRFSGRGGGGGGKMGGTGGMGGAMGGAGGMVGAMGGAGGMGGAMSAMNRPGLLGDPPMINSQKMNNFGSMDVMGDSARNSGRMGLLGKGPLGQSNMQSELQLGQGPLAPGSYPRQNQGGRASVTDQRASIMDQRANIMDQTQRAGLMEQRTGMLEQRPSMIDQRANMTDQRASLMDQRAGLLDQRAGVMNQRANLMDHSRPNAMDHQRANANVRDQRSSLMDHAGSLMNQRQGLIDQRPGLIDQRSNLMDQRPGLIDQRTSVMEQRQSLMEHQRPGLMEQRTSLMDQTANMLEQRANMLEQKANLMEQQAKARMMEQKRGNLGASQRGFTQTHVESTQDRFSMGQMDRDQDRYEMRDSLLGRYDHNDDARSNRSFGSQEGLPRGYDAEPDFHSGRDNLPRGGSNIRGPGMNKRGNAFSQQSQDSGLLGDGNLALSTMSAMSQAGQMGSMSDTQGNQALLSVNQKMINIQQQMLLQQQQQQQQQIQQQQQQQMQQQQQQQQAMRDSQLQMVNSLLQQQGLGSSQQHGGGGGGLMPTPQTGQSLLGAPRGMKQSLLGPKPKGGAGKKIPSIFDISPNKPGGGGGLLGKRGGGAGRNQSNSRDPQNKRPRRDSYGRTTDRRNNRSMERGRDRQNNDRQRPSSRDSASRWSDHSPAARKNDKRQSAGSSGSNSTRSREDRNSFSGRERSREDSESGRERSREDSGKGRERSREGEKKPEVYDPANPTTEEPELVDLTGLDEEIVPMETENDLDTKKSQEVTSEDVVPQEKAVEIVQAEENIEETEVKSTTSDKESDKDKKEESDGSPQKQKSNFYCHACNVECRDHQGFVNHMRGAKHKNKMASLFDLTKQKSEQIQARILAEEHLRRIESGKRSGNAGDSDAGKRPRDRRHSSDRERRRSHDRRHRDDDSLPDDLGDLVTLDEVGFEDDSMDVEAIQAQLEPLKSTTDEEKKKTEGDVTKEISSSVPTALGGSVVETVPPTEGDNSVKQSQQVVVNPDSDGPVGQNFVVQVTGYFCKLCHKFYNNETTAKTTHCMSQPHREKYKAALQRKITKMKGASSSVAGQEAETSSDGKDSKSGTVENGHTDPGAQTDQGEQSMEDKSHDSQDGKSHDSQVTDVVTGNQDLDSSLSVTQEMTDEEGQGTTDQDESLPGGNDQPGEESLAEETKAKMPPSAKKTGTNRATRGRRGRSRK